MWWSRGARGPLSVFPFALGTEDLDLGGNLIIKREEGYKVQRAEDKIEAKGLEENMEPTSVLFEVNLKSGVMGEVSCLLY